jgi:hypothetical protein
LNLLFLKFHEGVRGGGGGGGGGPWCFDQIQKI